MKKAKFKEFMQLFFIILAFIAFMSIAGAAGASDLGNLPVEELKVRLLVSLGVLIASSLIAKRLGGEHDNEIY